MLQPVNFKLQERNWVLWGICFKIKQSVYNQCINILCHLFHIWCMGFWYLYIIERINYYQKKKQWGLTWECYKNIVLIIKYPDLAEPYKESLVPCTVNTINKHHLNIPMLGNIIILWYCIRYHVSSSVHMLLWCKRFDAFCVFDFIFVRQRQISCLCGTTKYMIPTDIFTVIAFLPQIRDYTVYQKN